MKCVKCRKKDVALYQDNLCRECLSETFERLRPIIERNNEYLKNLKIVKNKSIEVTS